MLEVFVKNALELNNDEIVFLEDALLCYLSHPMILKYHKDEYKEIEDFATDLMKKIQQCKE